jgi:transposase-like protein
VIDRAKALRKGVTDSFGSRVRIQRCRQHKKRNVTDALPERMRAQVNSATSQASGEVRRARQLLENLARAARRATILNSACLVVVASVSVRLIL